MKESKWNEHVILVDADYVDKVAFDLTVNFERIIGRRIPQADMAKWLECVALDGGLRPIDRGERPEARSTNWTARHSKVHWANSKSAVYPSRT